MNAHRQSIHIDPPLDEYEAGADTAAQFGRTETENDK